MQLNNGQQKASEEVFQFLLSTQKELRLSGPAGVGKTFMLQYIMNNVMNEYENACKLMGVKPSIHTACLTATTNKATDVLTESTGFPAQTIHSFMNLKVWESNGKSNLQKTKSWTVHSGILLFIDESSMIDRELHKLILEGTDNTCKIIYVGDHCQMAPVHQTISTVYEGNAPFVELLEPVRNASQPALVDICEQWRNTVKTGIFSPIVEVPGVIDFIDGPAMKKLVDTDFSHESVNARILCYTNAKVHEYNDYIRELRQYSDSFQAGEILISNSVCTLNAKIILRVEQQVVVTKEISGITTVPLDSDTDLHCYTIELDGNHLVHIPADKKHYQELVKYYKRNKNWPMYYKLKNEFPDLRQKDACTVYKAQGSTYDYAILDLQNIGTCVSPEQLARMVYVALSRAQTRLYLYGALPPKYCGE